MKPVAALFVRRNSIYKTIEGVDAWDIDRDARRFPGGCPVVVHPPCRAWGTLKHLAKPREDERELSFFAIDCVRNWGGILEHPKRSALWPTYLPLPGTKDAYGGYSLSVDQSWWGHKAQKATLLYIVGCTQKELPDIPLRLDAITHFVATSGRRKDGTRVKNGKRELSKSAREHTPEDLAQWMVDVARRCTPTHGLVSNLFHQSLKQSI